MHLIGSTPGDLTQSILVTDNLTAESGFIGASANGGQLDQLIEELIERGFDTTIYDYSYVADKGQRISDCLKVASQFEVEPLLHHRPGPDRAPGAAAIAI